MSEYINKKLEYIEPDITAKKFKIINSLNNELISSVPFDEIFSKSENNWCYSLYDNGILVWFYERHGIVFFNRASGKIKWQRKDIKFRQNWGYYYNGNSEYVIAKGTSGPLHILDPETGIDVCSPIKRLWQIYSWPQFNVNLRIAAGKIIMCNGDVAENIIKFDWDEISYVEKILMERYSYSVI